MKVIDVLQVPSLNEMKILAGGKGCERDVETVNMMDAPDIIPYLKPNEFLITTAYHFKDEPMMLKQLVVTMAEKKCAALGVKTKRYLNEIPPEVFAAADELGLPLIEIPASLSLGEIVFQSLRAILDQRTDELTYAMEIHKQFTQLIMRGKGTDKLLSNLSDMIGHHIMLINQHLKPLSYSTTQTKLFSFLSSLQKQGYTFPVHPMKFSFTILATKQTFTAFPVYMSEKRIGYLLVSGEIKDEDRLNSLIIEQAANVLSFAMMKETALNQFNRSVRNDFFYHFLEGTFSTETEIINRAKEFSLNHSYKYICSVGKLDMIEATVTYKQHQQKIELIFEFIEEELIDSKSPIHFFTKGEQCILLYEIPHFSQEVNNLFELVLQEIQQKISAYYNDTISFGVSSLCQNLLYVPNAYKEAEAALKDGMLSKKRQFIQSYRMKDIIELLRAVPQEDLRSFYAYTLRGFESVGKEEEQTLLQTLSVYLDTQCQISETAKRLYVHRNTVVYRLEKCEDILGGNIKDSEMALRIRLALKIKSLLN
ncbi:PucR family transcriptional regulator [Bacillus sp. AGMB 02131]|uniref:PucR family transcriptional regulator n=1 Tax=Peribacillus faecalis TaxID=2772559 RepID=A0A927CTL8_9BACI|nr:PucR family transcriptional regulator [Peribacillus faecalis]